MQLHEMQMQKCHATPGTPISYFYALPKLRTSQLMNKIIKAHRGLEI